MLAAGLGGAIRTRLPELHPLRAVLRSQMLELALRHEHMAHELRPLLSAWAQAGIRVMLMKGFALSEFEYATRGERFHGDIDLLLPDDTATVMRAAHIAIAHGWRSDGQHADPRTWTHESAHLYSPGGQARLDIHRFVLATAGGLSCRRAQAITAGVWARAQWVDWQGVPIWRPAPLDAAVVNLILGRCWGGDGGGLKPADYLDLAVLQANSGLTNVHLATHAASLGGSHTAAAFLAACSAEDAQLELDPAVTQPPITAALRRDGLQPRRRLWGWRVGLLARHFPAAVATLGDVVAAWWAVRRGGDPRSHLARWTPASLPVRANLYEQNLVLVLVNWWTRLLYPRQWHKGVCVPRAYATYRALRRLGHPAVFFSGVARTPELVGHAWVEDERGELDLYGEINNRQKYCTLLRYPAES